MSDRDSLKENHKDQYVKYKNDEWKIIREGNKQASHIFETKEEAVDKAKDMAKKQNVQVIVQNMNGDK